MKVNSYLSGFSGATALFALVLGAGWHLRWWMIHPDPMTPVAGLCVGICIAGVLMGLGAVVRELVLMRRNRKLRSAA